MRVVLQRVISSSVEVDGEVIGSIKKGVNILLGISTEDTEEDIKYLTEKIVNLRIFEDENNKMNRSLLDVNGEMLVISQFTLYGDCRHGRRPSFCEAMPGEKAEALYEAFVSECKKYVAKVETGKFGADMKVNIVNDGPVTLIIKSKREL